jgi:hypothetical protein
MTIKDEIDQLSATQFLKKVYQASYCQEDKSIEQTVFIEKIVIRILRAIGSSLTEPFLVLSSTYFYLKDGIAEADDVILTKDWIDKLPPQSKYESFKTQLHHTLNTIDKVADKMNIGKIQVLITDHISSEADAYSTFYCHYLRIKPTIFSLSNEEREHLIAHEGVHMQTLDHTKERGLKWIILGVQLLTFRCLSFRRALVAGMIIYGIGNAIIEWMGRCQERAADQKAMTVLNSNVGMVNYIYSLLKQQYLKRHCSQEELQELDKSIDPRQIERAVRLYKINITPEGNNRFDDMHPPLTERLEQALNFCPSNS